MSNNNLPLIRCSWVKDDDLALQTYHDTEWGRPCFNDQTLFEYLSLELMQAGLSWTTVLHKRQAFRDAFHHFDYHQVATMQEDVPRLLTNPALIRNRRKLNAIIQNAQAILSLEASGTTFAAFVWRFVQDKPLRHQVDLTHPAPKTIPQAKALSQALKAAGFTFVGPVISYSFMQAGGLVNDHAKTCFVSQSPIIAK
ncbi:DNA-3-methyladenine glycosylase I [Weissella halotolerans]|nr:DNA-3-methyladenine glycosylase I [Weissella halotolerans]